MRRVLFALALLASATPLAAQHTHSHGGGATPSNWTLRLDRPEANQADVQLHDLGEGRWHVGTGPALIAYAPGANATGNYRLQATFTQARPSQHPEAYGLFVGGQGLDGPAQDYLYFVVRQDGKYSVRHRAGNEVHTLVDWTEDAAVARATPEGGATNELAVEVMDDGIALSVNGKEVARLPRAVNTNGVYGMRVNHRLDLQVRDFVHHAH